MGCMSHPCLTFRVFRAAAKNEPGKRIRETMTENTREPSIREMRDICQ